MARRALLEPPQRQTDKRKDEQRQRRAQAQQRVKRKGDGREEHQGARHQRGADRDMPRTHGGQPAREQRPPRHAIQQAREHQDLDEDPIGDRHEGQRRKRVGDAPAAALDDSE